MVGVHAERRGGGHWNHTFYRSVGMQTRVVHSSLVARTLNPRDSDSPLGFRSVPELRVGLRIFHTREYTWLCARLSCLPHTDPHPRKNLSGVPEKNELNCVRLAKEHGDGLHLPSHPELKEQILTSLNLTAESHTISSGHKDAPRETESLQQSLQGAQHQHRFRGLHFLGLKCAPPSWRDRLAKASPTP